MADRLMTVKDLADKLVVPVATIYQWRCRGSGPQGIRVGRHLRYRPEDVEAWLDDQADESRTS